MTHPPAANESSVGEPADRDTAQPDTTLSDPTPADPTLVEPLPAEPDESPTVPAPEPAETVVLPAEDEHLTDEPPADEPPIDDDAPRYEADYYSPTAETPTPEPAAPEPEPAPEPPHFEQIPPSGAGAPPPPPPPGPPPGAFFTGQGGFNRRALIRPTNGRYIAGVCAAVGRATNTDPILWRVLFAVMTLAGGIGLLAYLLGWLLIPAEGDTGSPVEAMFGRGRTTTSPPLVIIIAVGAVLTFAWVVSRNVGSAVLGLAVIVGTLALLARSNNRQPQEPPPPSTYPGFTGYPSTPPMYPSMQQQATAPAPSQPETLQTDTTGLEDTPPPMSPMPPVPPIPPMPVAPPIPTGGYRPAFAPHGPYASTSPYAASLGYPMAPTAPMGAYPGLVKPPKPPKPPKQRSKLGRLTLSVVAIAMGLLFLVDLNGASIPGTVYVGTVLALIAAGLIVGTWFGRARWLIPIGVLMTIGLAVSASANHFTDVQNIANIDETPASLAEVQPTYSTDVGNIRLDLSQVDFAGQTTDVEVDSTVGGNVEIILPATVDTVVKTDIQGGNSELFGKDLGGGLNQEHTVTDNGTDGQGGGTLNLTVDVNFGNVEVHR